MYPEPTLFDEPPAGVLHHAAFPRASSRPVSAALSRSSMERSIEERFRAFHARNPKVYERLVRLARSAKRRGLSHYSIKGLFELIRWHHALVTRGEPFKLNNVFTSRYARLIMDTEPDLQGFFETRELRS